MNPIESIIDKFPEVSSIENRAVCVFWRDDTQEFLVGWRMISKESVAYTEVKIKTNDLHILLNALQMLDIRVFSYQSKQIFKKIITQLQLDSHQLPISIPYIYDVELASYVYNGNANHSLESQTDYIKELKISEIGETILFLGKYWFDHINPGAMLDLWKIECQISFVLAEMELKGIELDTKRLESLKQEYYGISNQLVDQIRTITEDSNLNINSNKQLATKLDQLGFKLGKPGKSGSPSVREEVLEQLKSQDTTGLIEKILEYRTVSKMYSTYTDSLLNRVNSEDNRLHGEYYQTVAGTGRLSSSNPNLQNIPIRHPVYGPALRSCFVAKQGSVLVSSDYSQMELRILAHYTQDTKLVEAFRSNIDIHRVTASEIFDIPLDQVTPQQRSAGKTLNFALIYQQGSQATSKQLGISFAEGKKYHELYFQKFAGIKPFIVSTLEFGKNNGFIETLYGRRANYPDLNSEDGFARSNAERAAFNMRIQGTEADMVKMAMLEIRKNFQSANLMGSILLQIHDEIVMEVPKAELEISKKIIQESMELSQPLLVPLLVEVHSGLTWKDAK